MCITVTEKDLRELHIRRAARVIQFKRACRMKIIHTTLLLPVLLGGCSLPHNRPADSDARQFVDSQISTNLRLIELAQKSLKQASATGYSASLPPAKPAISTPSAPEAKSIETSKPKVVENKIPESIALTNKPKPTELVSLKNNNNNGILKPPVATNVKPVAHQSNSLLSNNVKNGGLLSGNKKSLSTAKPVVKPILPLVIKPVPLRQWHANVGLTLHSTLLKWSGEVPCNITGKWTIKWNSSKDYSIDSALTFRGEYLDAVTRLFNLYKKANSPLFIDVYQTQCLIIVSDAGETKK